MNRFGADAGRLELARESIGAVLRLREDHHSLHRERFEEVNHQLRLLRFQHEVELLIDAIDRGGNGRHRHRHRIAQERIGEMPNFLGHRCRVEHGLTVTRQHRRDLANRLDETHVEHAIGFIKDEERDLAEIDQPLLQEIDETPWRCHENVDALLDRAHLRALSNAAEDDGEADGRVATVTCETLCDLRGEFARRREYERLRLAANRQLHPRTQLGDETMDDRERERCGFAGTRLRDAEDVALCKRWRNRLRLNRRRALIAVGAQRFENRGNEPEISEVGGGGVCALRGGGGGGGGGGGSGGSSGSFRVGASRTGGFRVRSGAMIRNSHKMPFRHNGGAKGLNHGENRGSCRSGAIAFARRDR